APDCRATFAADQLVVPVTVPEPPRSFVQVTWVTPTLSLADPLTVTVLDDVLYVPPVAGAVMLTVGAWVSAGGVVTAMFPEVTAVKPVAVNCSVRTPSAPVIDKLVNVAAPLA